MAAMLSPLRRASAIDLLMLKVMAAHQSCGFCSDQSGRGVERVSGVVEALITSPASSIINAFAPVVEISMPKKYFMPDPQSALTTSQKVGRTVRLIELEYFSYFETTSSW